MGLPQKRQILRSFFDTLSGVREDAAFACQKSSIIEMPLVWQSHKTTEKLHVLHEKCLKIRKNMSRRDTLTVHCQLSAVN